MKRKEIPTNLIPLFFHFLSPFKGNIFVLFLLVIFIGSIPSIDSYLIKRLLDFIESNEDTIVRESFLKQITFWALIYAAWWEIVNWSWRAYDFFYLRSLPKVKAYVIQEFYSHVQHHSQHFFQHNLAGFITNRIAEASRSLEMIFCLTNEKIVRKIITLGAALFTLYQVNPVFSTIFFSWLVFFLGLSSLCSGKIRSLSTNWARSKSIIAGKIVDAISNIASIRMFNSYQHEEQYLGNYVNDMITAENILQWFMLKLRYFLGLSCSVMIFGMLYYLGNLRAQHQISVGDFALVIMLCLAVADDIWDFTQELGDLFEEIGSFSQSVDLLIPHAIQDKQLTTELEINKGTIEFNNVTFKYRHNNNIFQNKNVLIPGKQKVGLIGYSGSGKTTFVNLITRTFDIESGAILVDGRNIAEVPQYQLRQYISVIPQEPILFNRTIKENIKYGKLDASDEEIYEAARKAHIHEDILKMPFSYDSLCGERGTALSGGQRQRIAIARAILKNAPILILDEATSALDSITEKLIQDSLKNLMENKTVLVIAHRLSTLQNMDRILVFDKGNIVEDGSHEELIKTGSLYCKLWRTQSGGFITE